MYIHQHQQWPHFVWNKEAVAIKLAEVNKAAGYLEGRLSAIGFDAQMKAVVETVSHSVICSSEIEGVQLNSDQVRSSVARKLGVPISGEVASSHYVDGVVFPGVAEVLASFVRSVSILMRLLLPTLLRPMNAYSGRRESGHCPTWALLIS